MPVAFNSRPACRASSPPWSDRSTSVQPVNRMATFHTLWPWRSRTSLPDIRTLPGRSGGLLQVFDHCTEKTHGFAAGDTAMIESKRQGNAPVRFNASVDRHDIARDAAGAKDGHGRRHHHGRG